MMRHMHQAREHRPNRGRVARSGHPARRYRYESEAERFRAGWWRPVDTWSWAFYAAIGLVVVWFALLAVSAHA